MPNALEVSEVKIRLARGHEDGLVGWASCVLQGSIVLNNMAICRGADGELELKFPARFSRSGSKHFYFSPVTREARRGLEEAVLAQLPAPGGS